MPRALAIRSPVRMLVVASVLVNFLLLLYIVNSWSVVCDKPPLITVDYFHTRGLAEEGLSRDGANLSLSSLASKQITFVGGVPRSGTTLMRVMLDAHPDIRCGEETRVIPRILSMRNRWEKSGKEHDRLVAAGISELTLDVATRAFVSQIILNHGQPAKYLCNKDPLVLNYMSDVLRLYPKAKFVLMVRDGRAVAYSIVSRNVTISGVDTRNIVSTALFWNKIVNKMLSECRMVGSKQCMPVFYEKLVASPQEWMTKVLNFLDIPWHDNVLHHHELINKEFSLSKLEPSSNQVKEPVHTNSVEKWRSHIPLDVQRTIYRECDMLKELGYSLWGS